MSATLPDRSPAPPAEPASIEEMAALGFSPWQALTTGWVPPTNEEWSGLANPHLISVRLAWLTVQKSKDELIAAADELGDQGLMELVGQIGQSADWFEGLHKLLASAESRIMCAYAAGHSREDGRLSDRKCARSGGLNGGT